MKPTLAARIVLVALVILPQPIASAIIVVEGDCTLPDAVTAAETHSAVGACPGGSFGHDTIELTGNVTLTEIDGHLSQNGPNGLRAIQTGITIEGNGWTIERDDNAPEFRIFNNVDGTLILRNVRILNGYLTVDDVQVRGGGGIRNDSTLEIVDSTISGNQAVGDGLPALGGGILSNHTLVVTSSTISGNAAVSNNDDAEGGGVIAAGSLVSITNSTVSGNIVYSGTATARGGGVYIGTTVATISNSTMAGNFAFHTFAAPGDGAALHVGSSSTATVQGTILGDSFGENCSSTSSFIDAGGNLSDDSSCGTIPDTLTGLEGGLQNNGGPTPTHALLAGSSAIGEAGACGLATDQRGAPRFDPACDSGAFEYGGCPRLQLADDTVTSTEVHEECEIWVGPNFTVAGPSGDLTLTAGTSVGFFDSFEVEIGGTSAIGIDPDLQVESAREVARKAGWVPPEGDQ